MRKHIYIALLITCVPFSPVQSQEAQKQTQPLLIPAPREMTVKDNKISLTETGREAVILGTSSSPRPPLIRRGVEQLREAFKSLAGQELIIVSDTSAQGPDVT